MPNQPTHEERVAAELRDGAATARLRVEADEKNGQRTPSWIRALADTPA